MRNMHTHTHLLFADARGVRIVAERAVDLVAGIPVVGRHCGLVNIAATDVSVQRPQILPPGVLTVTQARLHNIPVPRILQVHTFVFKPVRNAAPSEARRIFNEGRAKRASERAKTELGGLA